MEAQTILKDFKSPKHKLIALFRSGRDKWHARALSHRQALRVARITLRDLRNSRDLWKGKYMQERERRLELEARLVQEARSTPKVCRPITAAVRHLGR